MSLLYAGKAGDTMRMYAQPSVKKDVNVENKKDVN